MSTWFARHRVEWIVESVRIFGFIKREHVMKKFGISKPQASTDFAAVLTQLPNLMRYDGRVKAYVLKELNHG